MDQHLAKIRSQPSCQFSLGLGGLAASPNTREQKMNAFVVGTCESFIISRFQKYFRKCVICAVNYFKIYICTNINSKYV